MSETEKVVADLLSDHCRYEDRKTAADLIAHQAARLEEVERERDEALVKYGDGQRELKGALNRLDAISAAIGSDRFLDPPDGGDVSLAEQVRRMHDALTAAEAEKERLLRGLKCAQQQCETAVYNISQREHDEAVVRSFQSIADFCARAALSPKKEQTDV